MPDPSGYHLLSNTFLDDTKVCYVRDDTTLNHKMFIIKCSFLISLQQVFQRWYGNVQIHDKRTHRMPPESFLRHINLDKIIIKSPRQGLHSS